MPVLTIRVDEDLKRAMDRLRDVTWSEVVRERIREVVEDRGRRNRLQALLLLERTKVKAVRGYDPTETIRSWRNRRYGKRGR
jgi:hypothetical protein